MRLSVVFVSLLVSVMMGFGCAPSDSSSDRPIADVKPKDPKGRTIKKDLYQAASCEFQSSEGESFVATFSKQPDLAGGNEISYFGKAYEQDGLAPILKASAQELFRFAKLIGVDFYSVSRYKNDSCDFGDFIPSAESRMRSHFAKVGENILGIYLNPKSKELDFANERAVILIRRDTNKWVMMHELFHHLFSVPAQAQMSDDDLKGKLTHASVRLGEAHKKVFEEKKNEYIPEMLQSAYEFGIHNFEIIKRFPLEEVAIEAELFKLYTQGHIQYAPKNQIINGAFYIESSAERARNWIKSSIEILNFAIVQHSIQPADSKLTETQIDEMRQRIAAMRGWEAELAPLVRDAQIRMYSEKFRGLTSFTASGQNEPADSEDLHVHGPECSRAQDLEQIFQLTETMGAQLSR